MSKETTPTPAENGLEMTEKELKAALKAQKQDEKRRRNERKKLYSEYKLAQKSLKRGRAPLLCPPDSAVKSGLSLALGKISRLVVVMFATFAMSLFVSDAFGFNTPDKKIISSGFLLLCAFLVTLCCSVPLFIKKKYISIPLTVLAILGISVALWEIYGTPNPIVCFTASFNSALDYMAECGYYSITSYKLGTEISPQALVPYVKTFFFVFTLLSGIIYSCCLGRRINITQFIIAGLYSAAILFVIFEYNITSGTWGTAFIIAAFSAAIVMAVYDFVYIRKQGSKKAGIFTSDELPLPALLRQKAEKKAQKALKKAQKTEKQKKKKPEKTVDEEISDYFADSKKAKPVKPTLTAAEKKALKAEKLRIRKQKQDEKRELRAYLAHKQRKVENGSAMGGFAGLAVFIVAVFILLIPASTITGPYNGFGNLNQKFEYYREYVTALLMGDSPALDILTYENNLDNFKSNPTEPTTIRYYGSKMFTVESNFKYPVYLRGWVATDYDDVTGMWKTVTPDSNQLSNYRALFGTNTDPSESLMYNFWRFSEPGSIPDIETFDYLQNSKTNSSLGFAVGQISVKRNDLKTNTLYMPAFNIRAGMFVGLTDSGIEANLLRSRTSAEASTISYADFFDGIYSSYKIGLKNDGFSAISMVTTMKSYLFYRNLAEDIVEINQSRAFIGRNLTPQNTISFFPLNPATNSLTEADPCARFYKIPLADGTVLSYCVTQKAPEGVTPKYYTLSKDDGVVAMSNNDGYKYVVIPQDVGNAYYKINSSGTIVAKYVDDVPENLKTDEAGAPVTYNAPELHFAIKFYECFDDSEREEFRDYLDTLDAYTPYVYETYARKSGSEVVQELTDTIVAQATKSVAQVFTETDENGEPYEYTKLVEVPASYPNAAERNGYRLVSTNVSTHLNEYEYDSGILDADVYRQRHELVMQVIDYMTDKDNYTYTLSPTTDYSSAIDLVGIEKFIAGSKEGSCVQFATATALVLRNLGIPARFVSGYIASDFYASYSEDAVLRYTSTVKDSNAHAWIEVWFDNVGWVQYECTPKYYDKMYEVYEENNSTTPEWTDPETEQDDTDETESSGLNDYELQKLEEQRRAEAKRKFIMTIVYIAIGALVLLALAVLFYIFVWKRAAAAQKARNELVDKIAHAKTTSPSREEFRALCDKTGYMLKLSGLTPALGENRDEYAERIASACSGALKAATDAEKLSDFEKEKAILTEEKVKRMLCAVAAEEFGYGADPEAMPLLARFYRRMYAYEYKHRVNPFTRLYVWLVLKKI